VGLKLTTARRKSEEHINSFPNYKVTLNDRLGKFDVHFAALLSAAPDAIPIILLHGWPGSFLEFLPMLDIVRKKYSPEDLKYHFIIPSLPGYTLSAAQPVSVDFSQADAARIMNTLMLELGFKKYIAQGGDVGSRVARVMSVEHEACQAIHRKHSIHISRLEPSLICALTLIVAQ
jgi:microsomal epoxide hydrolase